MFKTISERLGRIIQGFDMIFPANAANALNLFSLIRTAQLHVQNKTGQTPTVLIYSPTLKKIIEAIEGPLANELGILTRKEPRVPNDQLMLVHNEIDMAMVSVTAETFISFLDRQEATAGVYIGDVLPEGDAGESENYDDNEEAWIYASPY